MDQSLTSFEFAVWRDGLIADHGQTTTSSPLAAIGIHSMSRTTSHRDE
jgi:hypothetical protein